MYRLGMPTYEQLEKRVGVLKAALMRFAVDHGHTMSEPRNTCKYCEARHVLEEEAGKKHKEDKVGGIVDTIRKLRRGKNAKIL